MNISGNIQEIKEKEYEKVCKKIKLFIGMNPGLPKYEISRRMGISLDLMDELINQGMLEETMGEVRVASKIKRSYGEEKKEKFIEGLKVNNYNGNLNFTNEPDNNSKLVRDLEQKFKNMNEDKMLR